LRLGCCRVPYGFDTRNAVEEHRERSLVGLHPSHELAALRQPGLRPTLGLIRERAEIEHRVVQHDAKLVRQLRPARRALGDGNAAQVEVARGALVAAEGRRLEKATFAGGCFWSMQRDMEPIPGVVSVISGYTGGTKVNPHGPPNGSRRVCRGGSWKSRFSSLRTTVRGSNAPLFSCNDLGFRVVCECE